MSYANWYFNVKVKVLFVNLYINVIFKASYSSLYFYIVINTILIKSTILIPKSTPSQI